MHSLLREISSLKGIEALLSWDQEVYMPASAANDRASQLEWISREVHRRIVSPQLSACLETLSVSAGLEHDESSFVRVLKRFVDRERLLPEAHVAERTRISSLSYSAWVEAKKRNSFSLAVEPLERVVHIARREAELLGYHESPYDALLSNYEPDARIAEIKPLLVETARKLRPILTEIEERPAAASVALPDCPRSVQEALCHRVLADLGFDRSSGRMDESPHPFQATVGPRDVRITTSYCESSYLYSVLSVMHEVGHAFFELGIPQGMRGAMTSSLASTALHESQSRLYENAIGRSRAFASYLARIGREAGWDAGSPEEIWRAANRIQRSLVRLEADELTYAVHIVIRTLLEEALVRGDLQVRELPGAWSDLYHQYMGIRPSDDNSGVLQDSHWYCGLIGYFPSYALGDIFAAALFEALGREIPNLESRIERGELRCVRDWLAVRVHRDAMAMEPERVISSASGAPVSEESLVRYLRSKLIGD